MRGLVVAGVVSAGVGCSSTTTSIEQAWISDSTKRFELSNVVAMSTAPDRIVRRIFEERLAKELRAMGVRSVPAYAAVESRAHVVDELRAGGYHAVIVMRFVGEGARTPSTFGAYLETAGAFYGPGVVVRLETSVYTLDDDQLVWSALSKRVDPDGVLIGNYAHVIATELSRREVVASS
ncbi:MAG: hypothetical protein HOV81_06155 [Kofleriaceae bacterium]|nr:hypothetical protein [Kofleriaceae bacterium]